ncbi:MAG: adenylosuccinate lyase [Rhodobacteraceae bacterium]|nr:adenylosuccinate lyase [Paracoccaceae bacterium]
MTFKTILIGLALTVLPAASYAFCSGHEQQAQSCVPGMVWNAEAGTCVEQATS